ncbi:hypothetical protein L1887_62784 [Cichorium endivia]|nr:hypothetical protein L1887_62784 [Cichorium endivia]
MRVCKRALSETRLELVGKGGIEHRRPAGNKSGFRVGCVPTWCRPRTWQLSRKDRVCQVSIQGGMIGHRSLALAIAMVCSLRPMHMLCHGCWRSTWAGGSRLTSVGVGVLPGLEFALCLFEEVGEFPGVTNVAVPLERHADLDRPVAPYVPANAPVQLVLERCKMALVESRKMQWQIRQEPGSGRRRFQPLADPSTARDFKSPIRNPQFRARSRLPKKAILQHGQPRSPHLTVGVLDVARGDDRGDGVEGDKGDDDADVAAALGEADVEAGVEVVAPRVLAVAAVGRRIRVLEVAAKGVEEGAGPLRARLARLRLEASQLGLGTADGQLVHLVGDQTRHEVRERVDPVQPALEEVRQVRVGDRHTAKQRHDDDQERVEERRDVDRRRDRSHRLAERHSKQLGDEQHGEEVAGAVRARLEARGVVEEQEVHHRRRDAERHLLDQLRDRKHRAAVHLARVFADEHRACHDEERLDLRQDDRRQHRGHEDTEHTVLQRSDRVAEVEEAKTRDERDGGVLEEARELVVGLAPRAEQRALEHHLDLRAERGGELGLLLLLAFVLVGLGGSVGLLLDLLNLGEVLLEEIRLEVELRPRLVAHALHRSGSHGVEHVLGHVDLFGALGSALGKVVDNVRRVGSDGAKVDRLATALEQKQAVELLKEQRVGLVDRAQDRLTGRSELLEEAHHVVRRLTVQTRSGLVEEEQQVRARSKLHTDRHSLAVADAETELGNTDHGIRDLLHLEQLDNVLDVRILVLLGHVLRLAQVRTEAQSLAHRRRALVDVLLLGVTASTLEVDADLLAANQTVAADDTDRLAVSKHIEQSRLSGTRGTHERRQGTRAAVTVNVVQKLQLAALDGHRVADLLPSEWLRLDIELLAGILLLHRGTLLETLVELLLLLVGLLDNGQSAREGAVREHLDGDHRDGNQADKEDDDHAKVEPEIARVVAEAGAQVIVAGNKLVTRLSTGESAHLVGTDVVGIRVGSGRVARHNVRADAGEAEVLELVHHDARECEVERVDVRDPEEPAVHGVARDHVAGEHDERRDDDGGQTRCRVVRLADGTKQSEERRHGEVAGVDEDEEREEGACRALEPGHKVEDNGEEDDLGDRQRDVGEELRQAESRGAVESVVHLLVQHRAAAHLGGKLVEGGERVEEETDEEDTAASEGACGRLGEVEEDTTHDEGDGDGGGERDKDVEAVTEDHLHLTLGEHLDLAGEADGVDALGADAAVLVFQHGLSELLFCVVVSLKLCVVLLLLLHHVAVDLRVLEGLLETLGRRGNIVGSLALGEAVEVGVGASREEVGRGLTRVVLEAEVEEVGARLVARAKVDAAALVDDHDLVELLPDTLAGLVERDEGGEADNVGEDAHALGVVERRRGVETARGVVPAEHGGTRGHALGDTDTLALATRHATNGGGSDEGVCGVRDAEHLEEGVEHLLVERLDGLVRETLAGALEVESELERLLDGEGGKVEVVLLVVDGFALVLLAELVGADAAVADVAVDGDVAAALVGDGLKEGGAARAGASDDEHHLAGLGEAVEVLEELAAAVLVEGGHDLEDGAEESAGDGVREGADVEGHRVVAEHLEVGPRDADVLALDAGFGVLGLGGAEVLHQIKVVVVVGVGSVALNVLGLLGLLATVGVGLSAERGLEHGKLGLGTLDVDTALVAGRHVDGAVGGRRGSALRLEGRGSAGGYGSAAHGGRVALAERGADTDSRLGEGRAASYL